MKKFKVFREYSNFLEPALNGWIEESTQKNKRIDISFITQSEENINNSSFVILTICYELFYYNSPI